MDQWKKKPGGWCEPAREGILKTDPCNHQSLHILSDILRGYRLQSRQGQDCWLAPYQFQDAQWEWSGWFAKLEAVTCLIYLLSLQCDSKISTKSWRPFFKVPRDHWHQKATSLTKCSLKRMKANKAPRLTTEMILFHTSLYCFGKFPLNQVTVERTVSSNPKSGTLLTA